MAESTDVAAKYVAELQELRRKYHDAALPELQAFFKRHDRKPPEEFHDSSFLYIRSFDADVGVRPFSNIVHWHSPDLTLSPATSVNAYTNTLLAGETYVVRCALRNRGDLGVPSAKVELFLTDPSLGFDTRFATNLTLGNVPSAWVGSGASAAVEFLYTVPPSESGHKCLFARTFSFSPLELPFDDFQLDPRLDRHVAQQNLNIVGQAQAFSFQWVHLPNAHQRIALRALEPDELRALRHPVLADVKPALEFPRRGWGRIAKIEPTEPGVEEFHVTQDEEGIRVETRGREGLDLDAQRELTTAVRDVLRAVSAGKAKMSEHRDLFAKFRAMNTEARRSRFTLHLPDLGLGAGEAVGLEARALDASTDAADAIGGITLIVVGE